jgi:hypothetical protein
MVATLLNTVIDVQLVSRGDLQTFHKPARRDTIRGVGSEQDEHNERLKRFADRLEQLETLNADARDELLVAASEMVERAIRNDRMAVAASKQARADRMIARPSTAERHTRKRTGGR